MTTLATTLPELDGLLPRVREQLEVVRARREHVIEVARGAAETFARRARDARELLQRVAEAAHELEALARAEDAALRTALEALAEEMAEQLQAIAAARQEVEKKLDALDAGGDALRDELSLLVPAAAAAWHPVERGAHSFRDDLRSLAAELPTLTEEAAVDAEEVAAAAGQKQQALSQEWAQARQAMDAAFSTRTADLEACAGRLGQAVELHDIALEAATIENLDGPGTQLEGQIAHRLEADIEEPLRAAIDAASLVVGQAAQDETQTAFSLAAAGSELEEAAAAVRERIPTTEAHVAAARIAAGQVNVEWRR